MVDAAAELIRTTGMIPVPIGEIAQRADVSRSLVNAAFGDQVGLLQEVLTTEIKVLEEALDKVPSRPSVDWLATLAQTYFAFVAERGNTLSFVYRSAFMREHRPQSVRVLRNRYFRQVAKFLRVGLDLSIADSLSLTQILFTAPHETGRLVFTGTTEKSAGSAYVERTIRRSFEALIL